MSDEQHNPLGCTCPVCRAPVNAPCISIKWLFRGGKWEPTFQLREDGPHSKRVKRITKYGPEASKRG